MFRLYKLPRSPNRYYQDLGTKPANDSELFYQKKRLLSAHAAHTYRIKVWRDGKAVEYDHYLTVSALTLDTNPGACSALSEKSCSIYHRRPYACRTVPFHYSRAEASAESDLDAFVATPGYRCDTGDSAAVVLQSGRIVDPGIRRARADVLALVEQDRRWRRAIVRRMKSGGSGNSSLPSLQDVETNASVGATTTSMRVAWQIAADSGFIGAEECKALIAAQLATIARERAAARCTQDARETLAQMEAEYRHTLNGWPSAVSPR